MGLLVEYGIEGCLVQLVECVNLCVCEVMLSSDSTSSCFCLLGVQPLPPVKMLSQGFAGMGLAPSPIRTPTTPMMYPGAGMGMAPTQGMMGMGMAPTQGMMGMGMNMGAMPQANMTMGMRMPAMSMGSGMVQQQPKQGVDAFADFGNFRK